MRTLTALCLFTTVLKASSPQYSVATVPSPAGWPAGFLLPISINNLGQIVGYGINGGGNTQTFFGTSAGTAAVPFLTGSTNEEVGGINDNGYIVGTYNSSGSYYAFAGTASSIAPLPALSGWTGSGAAAINGSGEIVGTANVNANIVPFVVNSGVISLIPLPSGWVDAYGTVINSSGLVGGWDQDNGQAYLGTPSGVAIIPLPSGWFEFDGLSGLNDSGTAVGTAITPLGIQAWIGNTSGVSAIPLPPGATSAQDPHINNSGIVAGSSNKGGWIWDPVNGIRYLASLVPSGWAIDEVLAINNQDEILAGATTPNGSAVYVLLQGTGANRTFVSTSGSDTNTSVDCDPTAPCRTFAAALSVTNPGGEVVVLASGGYGAFTITQAVTITAIGVDASITATSGDGVDINTTGNVTIDGLGIHGQGTGSSGIKVANAGFLRLYNITEENFLNYGVLFAPSSSGNLAIYDSRFSDNGIGVSIQTAGNVYVKNTVADHNGDGFSLWTGNVVIEDSAVSSNTQFGLETGGGVLSLIRDQVIQNGTGIYAAEGAIQIANCNFAQNSTYAIQLIDGTVTGSNSGTSVVIGTINNGPLGTAVTLK